MKGNLMDDLLHLELLVAYVYQFLYTDGSMICMMLMIMINACLKFSYMCSPMVTPYSFSFSSGTGTFLKSQ